MPGTPLPGVLAPLGPLLDHYGYLAVAGLRADGAVEVRRVPAGAHRQLLHVQPGLRGVDDVAAADVHGDVALAVVVQQVTRLDGRRGDVREGRPLIVGGAGYLHAGRPPGGLGQAGAVVSAPARRAPLIRLAEPGAGERDALPRLGRGRPGVLRRRRAAVGADRVALHLLLLRHGQAGPRPPPGPAERAPPGLPGG